MRAEREDLWNVERYCRLTTIRLLGVGEFGLGFASPGWVAMAATLSWSDACTASISTRSKLTARILSVSRDAGTIASWHPRAQPLELALGQSGRVGPGSCGAK